MKFFLLFCFLLPLLSSGQQVAVQKLLAAKGLENAAVGISVKRITDHKVIAEYNPGMALRPASVSKLIATVLALKQKGENYTYRTKVSYTGGIRNNILEGDIMIDADGDPCFDSGYFPGYSLLEKVLSLIEKAGIKKIQGSIIVNNDGQDTPVPGSWIWEDISNYYGAVYFPFNYRDNTYTLNFRSGKAGTLTEITGVSPEQRDIEFKNEVRASEQERDNAWIYGGPYSSTMYVKGTIPRNKQSFKIKGAMHRPADCFVDELTRELGKKGIPVEKLTVGGNRKEWMMIDSPVIREIVLYTNKKSVNLFAEAMGKLVSQDGYQAKVCSILEEININASGITLKDASGLSPLNAVPASVFTDLLVWANDNLGDSFISSLPVAGGETSLNSGLNGYYGGNPLLKNNLKAKTGSFSGVRCLSGYVTTKSGELLAFTILVNNYSCTTAQLQTAVQNFLLDIRL